MESQVCPLLGLADERGAYLTYPSYENRCYASSPHQAIPLNEQTFFCLGGHKERCPRFQARQAAAPAGDGSAEPALAAPLAEQAFAAPEPEPAYPWAAPAAAAAAGYGFEEDYPPDEPLMEAGVGLPPSPPRSGRPSALSSRPQRPVWPLFLAAGTLVAVLVLCGVLSAAWLGVQTLSARLALAPSGTPLVETETVAAQLPITGTLTAGGFVIVVLTPTPAAGGGLPIATATPTSTPLAAMPTDTPTLFAPPTDAFPPPTPFPTPPLDNTPDARPTPTPRDTPTTAPTLTPGPTATLGPTVTPPPSATAPVESFVMRFTANPLTINAGQDVILTWEVRGVRAVYLDDDPVTGPTGSKKVRPTRTTTYVLRVIKTDSTVEEETQTVTVNVPTSTATPTVTPTSTSTPYYQISIAPNRTTAKIDGSGCQTGNGCAVFQIQISNLGNRPLEYRLEKLTDQLPTGWSAFFCFGSECEFANTTRARTINANSLETVALNFLLPSSVRDGDSGVITVKGRCTSGCNQNEYQQQFSILIDIPPTPVATGTATPTPTRTATPTATPTATSSVQRGITVAANPSSEATTDGTGCDATNGCELFDIVVTNTGVADDNYRAQIVETASRSGWQPVICAGSNCFPAGQTNSRSLAAGAQETLKIRLRLNTTPNAGETIEFRVEAFLTGDGPQDSKTLRIRYTG